MNLKMLCCTLVVAVLLCACQAGIESPNIMEDPPALEQAEQEAPPSDDGIEKEELEESDDLFPPVPPVCELDFTETESFPFPFEDELRVDYLHFPVRLLLTTEQALYDYDTSSRRLWTACESFSLLGICF